VYDNGKSKNKQGMGERLPMSANSYEISPIGPEQESIDGLTEMCHDQANQSRKFKLGENLESGTRIPIVDAHDTTYIIAFQAQHCLEESDPTEHHYSLSLSAAYTLVDMIPEELNRLARESDQPLLEADYIDQIVAEYSLDIYLDDDGTLQWSEGRNYSLWFVDDDGVVSDPDDDGLNANPRRSNYYLNLGQNLGDGDEELAQARETSLTHEEQAINQTFELMMGRAGLGSFEKAEYIKKAYKIFRSYRLGQEADFEIEEYFPDDIVQTINAQHTN